MFTEPEGDHHEVHDSLCLCSRSTRPCTSNLRQATQAGGEVGETAKTLAGLMHPHFVKEDRIALPPLGLLVALARGEATPEMAGVLELTDQLEAELPAMLAEHRTIVEALQKLRDAAKRAGRTEIVEFAQALIAACAHRGGSDVSGRRPGRPGGAAAPGPACAGRGVRMVAMQTPSFFDAVRPIVVVDPLAEALGAAEGGLIEYRYVDAVKLAGHSCPTVAGAWLMTRAALARLYPGETPRRGEMRVELRQAARRRRGRRHRQRGGAGHRCGQRGRLQGPGRSLRAQRSAALRRADERRDPLHAAGHRAQRSSCRTGRRWCRGQRA